MRRCVSWLGSDWRLPVGVAFVVGATFVVSAKGAAFVESAHAAFLQWQFDRAQAHVSADLKQLDAWREQQAKVKAVQLVDVMR